MNRIEKDLVVIGGGSAGLAAAVAAFDAGLKDILLLERDAELGGILNQCIHAGFGLHRFKEELTGPEYAERWAELFLERKIDYMLECTALELSADKKILAVSPSSGLVEIQAKAVVLAMGCRERARGALPIEGSRPAGIYTAGTAQRMVNIEGKLPGKRVCILGSGDIGLIMARRLSLEGAEVLCVAELMSQPGGLQRNIVQCLEDFNIDLKLSHTVTRIEGKNRVEAIYLAEVDEKLQPKLETETRIACDTLLLSVGLIPENELSTKAGIKINPVTKGAVVDEQLQCSIPGVFAAGNVLHVHDLVDFVSEEGELAGRSAAAYCKRESISDGPLIDIAHHKLIRYTVPAFIHTCALTQSLKFRFRLATSIKKACYKVYADETCVYQKKVVCALPSEMQELNLKPSIWPEHQISSIYFDVEVKDEDN